ncbi:MAG: ABC transporter substrate-binding protein [Candidatus Melainabacteria bacterium]|nr:ABC transporter substrate-binding protein [Candidatus Melainabacteria bacterium]
MLYRIKFFLFSLFLSSQLSALSSQLSVQTSYFKSKTIKINGVDYKQVQYPVGKFGGTLNQSIYGSGPKTFNIWASTDATSSEVGRLMFDSLFDTDPITGEVIPHLAKSYEIKDEGKTIIVKLREGIKWSDGIPITSDDVVFTWNKIVFTGLEGGGFQSLCLIDGKYPSVKKINDTTVEFMTHVVFAPFLRQVGYQVAPKHILEPVILKAGKDAKEIFLSFWGTETKPEDFVTSGPFKLKRYVQGQRIEFVRNPNYFVINSKSEKLPYLNKIIYTIIQDQSLELFKFLASEIDIISVRGEDVSLVKRLEKKNKFKIINLGPSSGTEFLVFNLSKNKWFNNLYFRKAISHAIDRLSIVDNVLAGVGKPLFTSESLASIYLNKKFAGGYSQDLNLSREFLKKGGFNWNSNGRLIDEKNQTVEFTILTNAENITRQAISVIIQDDLKKLGIKVNLRPLDFNTLIGRSDSGNWEAIIIGFTGGFFEPNDGANVWKLNGRLHLFDSSEHKPRDWEIEIDKIFNEATKYIDFQRRKKLYDIFQEVVYDKLPFIYLESPLRIVAIQNGLGNIFPTIYGGALHNLESIYKK